MPSPARGIGLANRAEQLLPENECAYPGHDRGTVQGAWGASDKGASYASDNVERSTYHHRPEAPSRRPQGMQASPRAGTYTAT
jgi:hypothetical protein